MGTSASMHELTGACRKCYASVAAEAATQYPSQLLPISPRVDQDRYQPSLSVCDIYLEKYVFQQTFSLIPT